MSRCLHQPVSEIRKLILINQPKVTQLVSGSLDSKPAFPTPDQALFSAQYPASLPCLSTSGISSLHFLVSMITAPKLGLLQDPRWVVVWGLTFRGSSPLGGRWTQTSVQGPQSLPMPSSSSHCVQVCVPTNGSQHLATHRLSVGDLPPPSCLVLLSCWALREAPSGFIKTSRALLS